MRKLPTILSAIFLAITLARVGAFSADAMQAGILGWLYAIGLGVAVYCASYWMRVNVPSVRRSAMITLVFVVIVDGGFNLAEVLRVVSDPSLRLGAWVYGLFPTIATGLLAWMQGSIDKMPKPPHKSAVRSALSARITGWLNPVNEVSEIEREPIKAITEASEPTRTADAVSAETNKYVCDICGKSYEKQRAFAGHMRSHKKPTGDK